MGKVAAAAGPEFQRHLVPEPPVVVRDAGDALEQLAPLRAPTMDHLHLATDQPPPAVLGAGADQLNPPHPERDATVGPGLRDQVQRGDDLPAPRLLDHREISRRKRRMSAPHQVLHPRRNVRVRPLHPRVTVDIGVERDQRLRVRQRRPPQHEPVPQILQHLHSPFTFPLAPERKNQRPRPGQAGPGPAPLAAATFSDS